MTTLNISKLGIFSLERYVSLLAGNDYAHFVSRLVYTQLRIAFIEIKYPHLSSQIKSCCFMRTIPIAVPDSEGPAVLRLFLLRWDKFLPAGEIELPK